MHGEDMIASTLVLYTIILLILVIVVAKQPHSLRSLLHLTHIRSYPQKGVTKGPV